MFAALFLAAGLALPFSGDAAPAYGFTLTLRDRPDGSERTVVPAMAVSRRADAREGLVTTTYAFDAAPVKSVRTLLRRTDASTVRCTLEVETARPSAA